MNSSCRLQRVGACWLPGLIALIGWSAPAVGATPVSTTHPDFRTIEEVVVVGSRARIESRVDELPVAVDLYQDTDLESTGEIDLGAALTKLSPSFNYTRLSVGDGALLIPATLRGLSPDQTLVLVNGKRRHSMAWLRLLDGVIGSGTGGTDLRAIPSAALARVEVLRDGAAAQYGSDAIAGVINLELRERADGGELTLHGGLGDGNGSRLGASFNGGAPLGAGGFLNFTGEWHDSAALQRNGGNGGLDPNYQDELITYSAPKHDGWALFFNAGLPVGDAGEWYAFGGLSRREGVSTGAYRFRYNYWEGLRSGDDTWDSVVPNAINFHERNTHPVYPDGFLPYEESRIDDLSIAAGWRGAMGSWDLDLSATYGENEFQFGVSDTINASIGAHFLYTNPAATVAEIVANAGPLAGDSGGIRFDQFTLNLDGRRSFEHGLVKALAVGFEHREENYRQVAGDEAAWSCGLPHAEDYRAFAVGPDGSPLTGTVAACGFQGYPGYSPGNASLSDDGRDSQAGYLELEVAPFEALRIGAALRAETYSDAGSKTTGKLTARLQVTGDLALRAAASTGFRAPSLSQRRFNSIVFVGSDRGLTTVFAANEGHAIPRAFGVDSLDHETSNNFSAGLVFSPSENFNLALDAYRIEIEKRVVRSRGIECAGSAACDAERVATAAFFFNGVDTETEGIDLTARWGMSVAGGYLWLEGNGNVTRTEIVRGRLPSGAPAGLRFEDYFGGWATDVLERGQPRRQANLTADWQRGGFGALLRMNHYGSTIQHPVDTGRIRTAAANLVDFEARLRFGATRWALGVSNVFDKLPTRLPKTHLSNVLWGVRYPTDTPFGLEGRFVYLRLGVNFDW